MVHKVEKEIGGRVYVYLQRSLYNDGKRKTEHVAYLGLKKKLTKEMIEERIREETTKKLH